MTTIKDIIDNANEENIANYVYQWYNVQKANEQEIIIKILRRLFSRNISQDHFKELSRTSCVTEQWILINIHYEDNDYFFWLIFGKIMGINNSIIGL
jgi:hypothetical protein